MGTVFCVILPEWEWGGEEGWMKCYEVLQFAGALIGTTNPAFRLSKHTDLASG